MFSGGGCESLSRDELEAWAHKRPELVEVLRDIELPRGFTLNDIYLMFDEELGGGLSKQEFVNGMFRLLFSDDYQRSCMLQLSVAEIKRDTKLMIARTEQRLTSSIQSCIASEFAIGRVVKQPGTDNVLSGSVFAASVDCRKAHEQPRSPASLTDSAGG